MIINQCLLFFIVLSLGQLVQSTPEKPDCNWVPDGEVGRMRDTKDCKKFYYCIKGKAPFQSQCPNHNDYQLYFNPKETACDKFYKAPDDCFPPPGPPGPPGIYIPPPTTTTTTPKPTTTQRPPRPPKLEEFEWDIDCDKYWCGLFPNTNGSCETYIICTNGKKEVKTCNGGLMFDDKSRECMPADQAKCWAELDAGPHVRKGPAKSECPEHENPASTPVETRSDGNLIQNPFLTGWGTWYQPFTCPRGTFASGIYTRREIAVQEGYPDDHAGIVSIQFKCQAPGGGGISRPIQSHARGLPQVNDTAEFEMCKGAMVGFRLNSVKRLGGGKDEIATDNVQGLCACSPPAYRKYDGEEGRGTWTTPQYCGKGQALCGMQAQMHPFVQLPNGTYDNTGLNNLKMKCCDVPIDQCVPKEDRVLVRECDNSLTDLDRRCDFDAQIGVSLDNENQELVDFYSSIGKDIEDPKLKTMLAARIKSYLTGRQKQGDVMMYHWDVISKPETEDATESPQKFYVAPYEKVELYQIVGRCGHVLMRTNRYQRMVKDGKTGGIKSVNHFEL